MPSLAYNAMLKKTGVELDLFTDQEMADFFMKVKIIRLANLKKNKIYILLQNLRGGVSYIGKRFQRFDSSLETENESIKCFYSDVNNLCKL